MQTLIENDLPCARCGYNLRAQAQDGACPECGAPVAEALANPLYIGDPRRVRWIRSGLWATALALGASGLIGTTLSIASSANYLMGGMTNFAFVYHVTWLEDIVLFIIVLVLLRRIERDAIRHALMAACLIVAALYATGKLPLNSWLMSILPEADILTWIKVAGVVLITLPLARTRSRWATVLLSVIAAASAASLYYMLVMRVQYPSGVMPQYVRWFWYGVMTVWKAVPMLAMLHTTALAELCCLTKFALWGRRLAQIAVAMYAAYVTIQVVMALGATLTARLVQTPFAMGAFMTMTPAINGMVLAIAVYLAALARRFRPIDAA